MDKVVEVREVENDTLLFQKKIESVVITDQGQYDYANDLLKETNKKIKFIDEKFGPSKKKAQEVVKDWKKLIDDLVKPLEEIKRSLQKILGVYIVEQNRIKREAEDKLLQEAEDKKLEDAETLAEYGQDEEADKVLSKRTRIDKTEVPQFNPGGTHTRTTWKAKVTDLNALVRAIADGKADIRCVFANSAYLNELARENRAKLNIPGVEAVSETTVASRG